RGRRRRPHPRHRRCGAGDPLSARRCGAHSPHRTRGRWTGRSREPYHRHGPLRRCPMIRIALSNLRSASGSLVAAGIAIAVSVAFMVAALLFSPAFGDTLENQVRSSWSDADVAVMVDESVDPSAPQEDAEVL